MNDKIICVNKTQFSFIMFFFNIVIKEFVNRNLTPV